MRQTKLIRLSVVIVCALVIGTSFLTPERMPKQAMQRVVDGGEVIFEYKGKKYALADLTAAAVMLDNKKIHLGLAGEHSAGKRGFRLQFDFKQLPALKPGKYELTTVVNHLDKDQKDGSVIFVYSGLAEGTEMVEENPADVSAEADQGGTFTITSAAIDAKAFKATISGTFEFTGKNVLEYAADKNITVKGSFKNVEVSYVAH